MCFLKDDSSNSKYFRFHNPGPSLALLLVFMNTDAVEGRGAGRQWGQHGPHEGRGGGQKREKRLREKMSGSLVCKFSLACRNGPFPALFLPRPIPQTSSGKSPLLT